MIKLIAGRLNNMNKSNYWLVNDFVFKVGDYAIVENMNGYDLVEIVGLVETDEEHINKLIGNKINKKVLGIVIKETLKEFKDNA